MATRNVIEVILEGKNKLAGPIGDATNSLDKLTGAAKKAALAFAGLGTAAVVIGAKFEQSMANVRAVTGATNEEFAALEAQARKLGAATAFSASQAADALLELSKMGFNVSEAIRASEGVLKLAGAEMIDMGEAASLTATTLRAMRFETGETNRVVNLLSAAASSSGLDMEKLRESLKFAAPEVGKLGGSLEETVAALALLADVNIAGSISGTALKKVFIELTLNAQKYADVIPRGTLETKGLAGVIDVLSKAGKKADKVYLNLGSRAGPQLQTLVSLGTRALGDMQGKITGTQKAFEKYDVQQNTTIGAFKRLLSALQEVSIAVFKLGDEGFKGVLDSAAKLTLENKQKLIDKLQPLIEGFKTLIAKVKEAATFMGTYSTQIKTTVKVIGTIVTALFALAQVMKIVNLVMAANPFVLVATAIATVIALVIQLVDHLGGWQVVWDNTVAGVKLGATLMIGFFRQLWEQIKFVSVLVAQVFFEISQRGEKLGKALALAVLNPLHFMDALSEVKEVFTTGFSDIWDPLVEKHQVAMAKIQQETDEKIRAITQSVKEVQEESKPGGGGGAPAAPVLPEEKDPFAGMEDALIKTKLGVEGVKSAIVEAGPPIAEAIDFQAERLAEFQKQMRIASDDAVDLFGDRMVSAFQRMGDGIATTLADVVADQKKFGEAMVKLMKDFVKKMVAEIVKLIAKLIALAILQALTGAGAISPAKVASVRKFLNIPEFIGGKARGGAIQRGQISVIGEKGPELFAPAVSGRIIPNHRAAESLGMMGPQQSVASAAAQIASALSNMRRAGPTGGRGGGGFRQSTVNLTVNVSSVFGGRGERRAIAEEVGAAMIESGLLSDFAAG